MAKGEKRAFARKLLGRFSIKTKERPHVVVCGGGPAGLLASILLDDLGIPTTVLERSAEIEGERVAVSLSKSGRRALERAGCLDTAMEAGEVRERVYQFDGESGEAKRLPNNAGRMTMTRSSLVRCLEGIASARSNVTLRKGVGVAGVARDGVGPSLRVTADDGTKIPASHVIGADGKWSSVRRSLKELDSRFDLETCPIFVIRMYRPTMPVGWAVDGICFARPADRDCKFHVQLVPLPCDGGLSIIMECFDEIVDKCPWLTPPIVGETSDDDVGESWTSDDEPSRSDESLVSNLSNLFRESMPALHLALGESTFRTARIDHRLSWVKSVAPEGGGDLSYSTVDGRVALVGDAAHAMTPSLGKGTNSALRGVMKLEECITFQMEEKDETECSLSTLSDAFIMYGSECHAVAHLIQRNSLNRNVFLKT